MPLELAYGLMILFAATFGGAVGSFLNVVIYRLPNGLSLISPPSHCPVCKTAICWYDNVPVFGWIMLRGRCRNCRCPISIRYPLVEAVTAAMFAALALVENPLQAAYPCHVLLLSTLLCSALIEIDGHRPPIRLFLPTLAASVVVPLLWPVWQPTLTHHPEIATPFDLPVGFAAGLVLGSLLHLIQVARQKNQAEPLKPPVAGLALGLIAVGTLLGWPSLTVITLASVGVYALLLVPARERTNLRVPPSLWLLIATLTWLLASFALATNGR